MASEALGQREAVVGGVTRQGLSLADAAYEALHLLEGVVGVVRARSAPQARGLARQGLRRTGVTSEALGQREAVVVVVTRQGLRLAGVASEAIRLRRGVDGGVAARTARLFRGPSK